jgi:ribosome-binding protein aMBF1 (putative translation factor)
MSTSGTTRSAVEILHRRYVGDDPERLASLERERARAQIARQVYELRTRAGLTQAQLAATVGVSEAVIRRLEEADY